MTKKKQTVIIKRRGRTQVYDEKQVYASVYSAAIICEYSEKKAESIALKVMKSVNYWVKKHKKNISSANIRQQVIRVLKDLDVRIIYKHYLDRLGLLL